jgi:aminoglycoside phosphotransferase (APT) family kinase protein
MKTPAPHDPALPALGTALDGEAMQEVLQRRLGERLELHSCRACYVRYKPRTNALVKYEIRTRDGGRPLVAHARLFADETAAAIFARRSLRRLVERAFESGATEGAIYLPELPAIVQFYPVDLKLPALTSALSPEHVATALGQAGLDAGLEQHEPPELIRYKPTRKALLRFEHAGGRLYVKLHADTRGARHMLFGDVLQSAGFPAAAPLLYHPELRMLVHSEQAGTSLRALRRVPDFLGWMEPLAEALARFHSTSLDMLPARAAAYEARRARDSAASLAALLPARASELRGLGERLADHLEHATTPPAPVHGDFWDDQVLVSDQGVVLLDFDELRLGDPLVDVANLLAQLTVRQSEPVHESEAVRATFLDSYVSRRPHDSDRLALHEAAALLRSAVGSFRRLEPGWPESASHVVGLASDCLRDYERGRKRVVGRRRRSDSQPRDPALPQLEPLFDSARMADVLEHDVFGDPVTVRESAVVKHKPGRRCTIRYELGVSRNGSEQSIRLYGKTFASPRGPRVHELLCDIAEARPFGLDVEVTAPVAYLGPLKLSLSRPLAGDPIASALVAGDGALAARLAQALYRFHRSGLTLRRLHTLHAELEPLRARVDALGIVYPELQSVARSCLATIMARGRGTGRWRRRPAHRDFYYGQVLWDGKRLSILDLDDAAVADPALDVANFLGHLTLLALERPEAGEALSAAARAFEEQYRTLDGRLDPTLVELLTAATLLRLAHIHGAKPNGERLAPMLIHECRRSLAVG